MPIHDWTRVEPGTFHGFHVLWIAELAGKLNKILPSQYYAMPEKKVIGWEPDVVRLDLGTSESRNGLSHDSPSTSGAPGGVGLSLTSSPPKVGIALSRPATGKQRVIAIRRADGDRVVAVIEIVSPGNKSSGHAIRAFVAKAVELLERGIHVHVIDLFPPTPRDPHGIHEAIWNAYAESPSPPQTKPLTVATYVAGDEERAFVQAMSVGESLPVMPLVLGSDLYFQVPLEESYMASLDKFPRRWRDVLAAPAN